MLMSNMGGKLAILAVVPKALAGKLSAKIWSGKATCLPCRTDSARLCAFGRS